MQIGYGGGKIVSENYFFLYTLEIMYYIIVLRFAC